VRLYTGRPLIFVRLYTGQPLIFVRLYTGRPLIFVRLYTVRPLVFVRLYTRQSGEPSYLEGLGTIVSCGPYLEEHPNTDLYCTVSTYS